MGSSILPRSAKYKFMSAATNEAMDVIIHMNMSELLEIQKKIKQQIELLKERERLLSILKKAN